MAYISVREAAAAWGVSERLVQRYCAQGRIAGARKFGVSWEIPAGTRGCRRPRGLRRTRRNRRGARTRGCCR